MLVRLTSLCGVLVVFVGCSGAPTAVTPAPTAPTPVAPTPDAPDQNHPATIVDASVTPTIGVSQLTRFRAHVTATDPDGDPLSTAWSSNSIPVGGTPEVEFTACSCRFQGSSIISPLTVTVSDAKGGRSTRSVGFIVAGLTGHFDGYYDEGRGDLFIMDLTQTGNAVTGTFVDVRRNRSGVTDPAEPGRVEADGRFRLRFKLDSEPDFVLTGQFAINPDPFVGRFLSGYVGTGVAFGGPHAGQTFIFGEHNPY
jgi:hypothetical protein